jgi:hypothetical protein
MRKALYAIAAVIMAGAAALGAGIPAASAAAVHPSTSIAPVADVTPSIVPISGHICDGKVGGGCWWETAIQFWYDMKQGQNVRADLAKVYKEYNGNFRDNWTDDNAWWGITWQLAYQKYGVAKYHAVALSLWTWDTTPKEGWDKHCGGSTLQHPGGTEDDISRAALGVLSSALGKKAAAASAAAWIFKYMQGSNRHNAAAEGLKKCPKTGKCPCIASATAELGGQTESWKIEQLTNGPGQAGTEAKARHEHPFKKYNGIFNLLFKQYIG